MSISQRAQIFLDIPLLKQNDQYLGIIAVSLQVLRQLANLFPERQLPVFLFIVDFVTMFIFAEMQQILELVEYLLSFFHD